MRRKTRQRLETQIQRLEQQRHAARQQLRAMVTQMHLAQRTRAGEYVELAGLAHLDPGTLLGGLCELATLLTDPAHLARWKMEGDARLAAHHQRKAHRRRPTSSQERGSSEAETEGMSS